MSADVLIRTTGASIGYGDSAVLAGIDLTVQRGEVCAILGPNGCGKTTLVKGILGLARVFGGEVELFGQPSDSFHDRAAFGYVPQRINVGGGLPVTVLETVASGRLSRMRRFRTMQSSDRDAIKAAIDVVGLGRQTHAQMSELSGGQQRRVLIARALAGDPEVLVMDEPLAGVDVAHQALLAQTLNRLVSDGRTILIVLHELGPLAPLITRVVAMDAGRIVYDGPTRPVDIHVHGREDHLHDATPTTRASVPTAWGEH